MAVMNMIPLFLLAGRNNPVIKLTGISFDTMNLVHRWFGRIVILEALAHTICWIAVKVHTSKSNHGINPRNHADCKQRAGLSFKLQLPVAHSS